MTLGQDLASRASDVWKQWAPRIGVDGLIVGLAAYLGYLKRYGFHHPLFPDEYRSALGSAAYMVTGNLANRDYTYGEAARSVYTLFNVPYYLHGTWAGKFRDLAHLDPVELLYFDRIVTTWFALATVILGYVIGCKIAGRTQGIVIALLIALNNEHSAWSGFTKPDIPGLFWCMASVYAAVLFQSTRKYGWFCAVGWLAGFSVAHKLNTLPILALPYLVAWVWSPNQQVIETRFRFPTNTVVATLAILFGFYLPSPSTLQDFSVYLNSTFYMLGQSSNSALGLDAVYTLYSKTSELMESSVIPLVAPIGCVMLCWRKRTLPFGLYCLVVLGFYVVASGGSETTPIYKSHLIQVLFAIALPFSVVLVSLIDRLVEHVRALKTTRGSVSRGLAVAAILVLIGLSPTKPLAWIVGDLQYLAFGPGKLDISPDPRLHNALAEYGDLTESLREKGWDAELSLTNASFEADDPFRAWHVDGRVVRVTGEGEQNAAWVQAGARLTQIVSGSQFGDALTFTYGPLLSSQILRSHVFLSVAAVDRHLRVVHRNVYSLARSGPYNWRELDIDFSGRSAVGIWNQFHRDVRGDLERDGVDWPSVRYVILTVGVDSDTAEAASVFDAFEVRVDK